MRMILMLLVCTSLSACGSSAYVNAPDTTAGDANNVAASQNAAVAWAPAATGALMYGIDSALSDAYLFMPQNGTRAVEVNVTSACRNSFDSNGSINVLGTYTPQANGAGGNFQLAINFNACPLLGEDGNTYTVDAQNLMVNVAVVSSTATDATLTNVFNCTALSGEATVATVQGGSLCLLSAVNTVSYVWNDNLSVAGSYTATVCGVLQAGSVAKTLPVVVP